ncbi:MAG: serine protease, partial [Flavobacteriaceae bacterium]|nr:serine protease [Flavobacteriaceae bacterium]
VVIPQLGTLKKASKKELKVYGTDYGVKLSLLTPITYYNRYWNKVGIHEGVIITAIDGNKIYSIEDVEKTLNGKHQDDPITIELINKKGERERYSFGK